MSTAISTQGLVKTFGSTGALNGLDLTVREGEVHGFLGPNGAGKSTTIRILLGILRADSGQVSVLGKDPWADAVDLHRRLAYVPATSSCGRRHGEAIDARSLRSGLDTRRDELIERFDLDPTKGLFLRAAGRRSRSSRLC